METSPDTEEAHMLAGWYALNGGTVEIANVSRRSTGPVASMLLDRLSDNSLLCVDVNDLWLIGVADLARIGEHEDKGAYFTVLAMVSKVRTENVLYKVSKHCMFSVAERLSIGGMLRAEMRQEGGRTQRQVPLRQVQQDGGKVQIRDDVDGE